MNNIENGIYSYNEDITNLKDCFVEDHGEGEQVTLTNICNVSAFNSNIISRDGFTAGSVQDGIATYTNSGGNERSPYLGLAGRNAFPFPTYGDWAVGFKFRFTKIDQSLSDPANFRIIIGANDITDFHDWGVWNDFFGITTINGSESNTPRVRIAARSFPSDLTSGQFTLEIKDMYIYDVSDASAEMRTYIQNQQSTNYQDGTVTYGEATTTSLIPDDTLSESGKAADSKAVGDAISAVQTSCGEAIDDINASLKDCFVDEHGESEVVTLTNLENAANFSEHGSREGFNRTTGNVWTANGTHASPYVFHANAWGTKKWIVGFKYKLTKVDPNLSNPGSIRIHLGFDTYYDTDPVWEQWVSFAKVATLDLGRIRFAARNFPSTPSANSFNVEFKDMYVYDATGVSDEMCDFIIAQQDASYQDGTVTYGEATTTSLAPDDTLSKAGKAADAKAVGDAISAIQTETDDKLSAIITTPSATLTNADSLANFGALYGLKRDSLETNLAVFSPSSTTDSNPSLRHMCNLGTGKWLVGFKYKITKLDQTLGDPKRIRLYLGATQYFDYVPTYDDWVTVAEIAETDLTRIYFMLHNYTTAPTAGQLKLEVKDFYVYNIQSIESTELVREIVEKQGSAYKDGTATYEVIEFVPALSLSLGKRNVKNYGVVGDGVADDTDAIRAMFSLGSGVYYFPAGTYLITGTITIPANTTVYGDGDDTVIDMHSCLSLTQCVFRGGESVYPYLLVTSENVTLKQFKLIGNNTLLQQRHAGIGVLDTQRVTIEDLTIYNINFDPEQDNNADVSGYGICVTRSKYATVQRCDVRRCGYECIGVVDSCDFCTVRDCYTQDGWRTCIQVHRGSCDTTIENCYMKQTHTKYDACFTVHGLTDSNVVKNLRVLNCTAECTADGAQTQDYCAPYQIMSYAECLVFSGNRVFGGKRAFFINSSSTNAKIIGNDFQCNDQSDYGVTIGALNSIVIGNSLANEAETANRISQNPVLIGNIGIE